MKAPRYLLPVLCLMLLLGAAGLGYAYYETDTRLKASQANLVEASATIDDLTTNTESLQQALAEERARNEELTDDVHDLRGTVRKLDKIVSTDPELLQKYSKVYFLNENYAPAATTTIPDEYVYGTESESIDKRVYPFLEELIEDAKKDDVELLVSSGYRSFGEQGALKSSYTVRYGSGANAFSADQGYSEHQLGTTVDFTTAALGALTVSFENTDAFAWLRKNAYKYGFVLSYPKGNAYYIYEPWHWRFVGRDLAKLLRNEGRSFYDLDQREIDEYLGEIFE